MWFIAGALDEKNGVNADGISSVTTLQSPGRPPPARVLSNSFVRDLPCEKSPKLNLISAPATGRTRERQRQTNSARIPIRIPNAGQLKIKNWRFAPRHCAKR